MTDANEAYRRAIQALAAHDLGALAAALDPDVLDHNPMPGQSSGIAGFVEFMDTLHAALGDLSLDVERVIAEGDFAAARIVWRGVHRGPLAGVHPTGHPVTIPALHLVRVQSGKVAEWWGHADISDLTAG